MDILRYFWWKSSEGCKVVFKTLLKNRFCHPFMKLNAKMVLFIWVLLIAGRRIKNWHGIWCKSILVVSFWEIYVSNKQKQTETNKKQALIPAWPKNQRPVNTRASWFFLLQSSPFQPEVVRLHFLLSQLLEGGEKSSDCITYHSFPLPIDFAPLSLPGALIFFLGFLRKLCSPGIFICQEEALFTLFLRPCRCNTCCSRLRTVVWVSEGSHGKPLKESNLRTSDLWGDKGSHRCLLYLSLCVRCCLLWDSTILHNSLQTRNGLREEITPYLEVYSGELMMSHLCLPRSQLITSGFEEWRFYEYNDSEGDLWNTSWT